MSRSKAERIVLPDVTDDENTLLQRLVAELHARHTRNWIRECYYDGKRAVKDMARVVPPMYYKLGIVLGWSAKIVDTLARRCNLDTLVWPDGKLADLGLPEWWEDNALGSEMDSAIVSSLIHGPAFLINLTGEEGEPESLLQVRDALSATGDWDRRARRMRNLLSVTGHDDNGKITSLVLYLDGQTITAERDSATSPWQVDRHEHSWGVPVEMLRYRPRVGRPFGRSRISRPVMSLQDQATRELIRTEGHMDVYSFPELWMLGADEAVFKDSSGALKPSWQVMLGRIKGIPDDEDATQPRADVKQFPASSPSAHLSWLNALAKMMAREGSLPDTALAMTDMSNPTSADAYDASQHELIAEAEGATDDWTPAIRRASIRGLAIQNGITGQDAIPPTWATIAPKWRDPRYISRAAAADAGQKQLASIPWLAETEVGLELLGLDPQQITRALAERRRAAANQRLDALIGAGEAEPGPDADGG